MFDDLSYEREIELELAAAPARLQNAETDRQASVVQSEIHPRVFQFGIGLFALLTSAFLVTFASDGRTSFMIGVCAVYGAMYFGGGTLLYRMRRDEAKHEELSHFLRNPVRTHSGDVSGFSAAAQILLVPLALTLCVVGLCVIIAGSL